MKVNRKGNRPVQLAQRPASNVERQKRMTEIKVRSVNVRRNVHEQCFRLIARLFNLTVPGKIFLGRVHLSFVNSNLAHRDSVLRCAAAQSFFLNVSRRAAKFIDKKENGQEIRTTRFVGKPDETLNNGKATPKAHQHIQDARRRNTRGTQPDNSNDTARSAYRKPLHRPDLP
jgi:hypothetical protein